MNQWEDQKSRIQQVRAPDFFFYQGEIHIYQLQRPVSLNLEDFSFGERTFSVTKAQLAGQISQNRHWRFLFPSRFSYTITQCTQKCKNMRPLTPPFGGVTGPWVRRGCGGGQISKSENFLERSLNPLVSPW